jgi:hypothetical protein
MEKWFQYSSSQFPVLIPMAISDVSNRKAEMSFLFFLTAKFLVKRFLPLEPVKFSNSHQSDVSSLSIIHTSTLINPSSLVVICVNVRH